MAQCLGQGNQRPVHHQFLSLELSGQLYRPAMVSQVIFNLSQDDRYSKGDEVVAQFRVEHPDGF